MAMAVGKKFGFPIHRLPVGADMFVIPYAKVGIEIEVENCRQIGASPLLHSWDSHRDDSLRNNGMEFTTKGHGLIGKELINAVTDICEFVQKMQYSVGYPRAGIHLHVDMTDMNEENNTELLNCVLSYMLFEKAVFGFAGQWREACGFCDPLSMSQRDFPYISDLLYNWEKPEPLNERKFSKYQAINFLPLAKFGTLEFRQLPTTFDSKRILDWINICLSFKQYGKSVNVDPVDYLEEHGFKKFCEAVFGKALPAIESFIDQRQVVSAIADVRSLRVGKRSAVVADSWDLPNNSLFKLKEIKQKKIKPQPEGVEAAEAAPEPVRRVTIPRGLGRHARWGPGLVGERIAVQHPNNADLNFEALAGRANAPAQNVAGQRLGRDLLAPNPFARHIMRVVQGVPMNVENAEWRAWERGVHPMQINQPLEDEGLVRQEQQNVADGRVVAIDPFAEIFRNVPVPRPRGN